MACPPGSEPPPAAGQRCGMVQLRRPGAARGPDSALSEGGGGRHVSGQRHRSPPHVPRPARRACPLHLFSTVFAAWCGMMASAPLPPRASWPEREAGRRTESAGAGGGGTYRNLQRRLPAGPHCGCRGRLDAVAGWDPSPAWPVCLAGRRMGVEAPRVA